MKNHSSVQHESPRRFCIFGNLRTPFAGAYAEGGGGALGARAHTPPPPPHLEKSSAQRYSKEERKFRPDMSAKESVHVPLRYDKMKTKKVGKNKKIVKRKG